MTLGRTQVTQCAFGRAARYVQVCAVIPRGITAHEQIGEHLAATGKNVAL